MNELFIFNFLFFIYILRGEAVTVHMLPWQKKKTQRQPFAYVLQNGCF